MIYSSSIAKIAKISPFNDIEYDAGNFIFSIKKESILQFQKFKNSFSTAVFGGDIQLHDFISLLFTFTSKISFFLPNIIFPVLIVSCI